MDTCAVCVPVFGYQSYIWHDEIAEGATVWAAAICGRPCFCICLHLLASVSFAIAPRLRSCCVCFAFRLRLAQLIPAHTGRPIWRAPPWYGLPPPLGEPGEGSNFNPPDQLWH